jgi:selenocysteine lyase/cysteine desulfurase
VAAYVGARPEDIVFVHNATFGVNVVARALDLQPGDEVLTTLHEYGACSNAWELVCAQRGARYVRQPFTWPVSDEAQLIEEIWQGVTPRTKVLYFSHITSPTALTLPVAALCRRARAAGILTVIDGAHAPGQVDIDLTTLDADIYTGNLHKWLCAPKGAGFLWVRSALQAQITPLVVSWGYGPERTNFEENDFISAHQWQGTDDISAYLSVPAAIQFQAEHDWPAVRQQCHTLLSATLARLTRSRVRRHLYPPRRPLSPDGRGAAARRRPTRRRSSNGSPPHTASRFRALRGRGGRSCASPSQLGRGPRYNTVGRRAHIPGMGQCAPRGRVGRPAHSRNVRDRCCRFTHSVKKYARSADSGMYWLACRKMARSVPVSSSLCCGMVRVCFSPAGPMRRSFTWLPACAYTVKPKSSKTAITAAPESRRSLGIDRLHLQCHDQRRMGV